MKTEVNINGNILTWAIARAGHDLHDFLTSNPKIADWVNKKKKPTVKQLESFSQKVHIPFGYLFLNEPPIEKLPIPFFRTTKGTEQINLNVFDTISLLQRRQDWLSSYLKENDFQKLEFVGRFNVQSEPQPIVDDIRKTLGLEELWASHFSSWEKALEFLTNKIEEVGIITTFNSVVGNNTTRKINVEDCRGFILVDDYAPFMFINAADAKAAQMFTIVHELAHIWTGQSAAFDFRQLTPADEPIELLCDKIAAEFLVPKHAFIDEWENSTDFKALSKTFKVSQIVIARRALDLNLISKPSFFNFYNTYAENWKLKKESQRGGGDFYATAKKRISLTFAGHVNNAVRSNQLLYRDANKLTGLKGDTYQKFLNKHFT